MSKTTTIDKAGRLVVPKEMREKLNLREGSKVRLDVVGDKLEVEPELVEARVALAEDGLPIIRGTGEFDAVEAIEESRQDREESLTNKLRRRNGR